MAAAGNKKASVCTLRGLGTGGGDYDSARAPAAGREAWEKRQAWKIDPRSADARTQLSSSSVLRPPSVGLALIEASECFTLITVAVAARSPVSSLHSPGCASARLPVRGHRRAAPSPEADSSPPPPRPRLSPSSLPRLFLLYVLEVTHDRCRTICFRDRNDDEKGLPSYSSS